MIDAPPAQDAPAPLRIPDPALVFEERGARLAALAPSSATGEYLLLAARMARGQARAVREIAVPGAPRGGPLPIAPSRLPREAAWRRMLGLVLVESGAPGLPRQALEAIRRLEDDGVNALERLAEAVLAGRVDPGLAPDALATAPFVGAALQAYYGKLAAGVDPAAVPAAERGCPLCGSPPVAGLVQGDDRARYLSCSLCAAQWYVPRIRCTSCQAGETVSYLEIEGDPGARAEACDACKSYLKLFDLAKRPGAEPAADDLATLALDLLVAEEGYARGGANLLLWSAG
ncbi:MAG TPA: formate dehydrogenase accessory protein FdhE [Anaeromyxobacteraceae bacterium]|nr:formate dehydrogenase accessory protein FdhE [Anaeromyxobacteraceae bacterium]